MVRFKPNKSRRAISTLKNPDYEFFPKIMKREPGDFSIQFASKPIHESEIPMEVLYSRHVDKVRKIDKDKEQNPRPIKMKFIQENGELSYVKLEPMAFENAVFENIKLKFQSYSMMRE